MTVLLILLAVKTLALVAAGALWLYENLPSEETR